MVSLKFDGLLLPNFFIASDFPTIAVSMPFGCDPTIKKVIFGSNLWGITPEFFREKLTHCSR